MQNKNFIYRWILTACIMLWSCMPAAWADNPYLQSSTPVPAYEFHTTSYYVSRMAATPSFTPIADEPYAGMVKMGGIRRGGNPWDEDGDDNPWGENNNPIGEVDDPLPIGEPFILLMLAMLYLAKVLIQRRKERGCYQ